MHTVKRTRRTVLYVSVAVLLFIVILSFSVWASFFRKTTEKSLSPTSFLVCGVDEAGNNTDVMIYCTVSPFTKELFFLQLPRDTFLSCENGVPTKINSRFAHHLSVKKDKQAAAIALVQELSSLFSLKVDHIVLVDMKTVSNMVDALGGVTLHVPQSFSYTDPLTGESKTLSSGEQTLLGQDAVSFLRYRKGYTTGDLARMDAQKLFLFALLERISQIDMSLPLLLRLGDTVSSGAIYTDVPLRDAVSLFLKVKGGDGDLKVTATTLPGEALYTEGRWYYIVHRMAADRLFSNHFPQFYNAEAKIDPKRNFSHQKNIAIQNAYEDPNTAWRIYTASSEDARRLFETLR